MMTTAKSVEVLHEHLRCRYLHDRQIIVFDLLSIEPEVIDLWVKATLERKFSDAPYHVIHNVHEAVFTAYARKKAIQLAHELGRTQGRNAYIFPRSTSRHLMRFFVSVILNRFNKTRKRKIFTEFDKALKWIEEVL